MKHSFSLFLSFLFLLCCLFGCGKTQAYCVGDLDCKMTYCSGEARFEGDLIMKMGEGFSFVLTSPVQLKGAELSGDENGEKILLGEIESPLADKSDFSSLSRALEKLQNGCAELAKGQGNVIFFESEAELFEEEFSKSDKKLKRLSGPVGSFLFS